MLRIAHPRSSRASSETILKAERVCPAAALVTASETRNPPARHYDLRREPRCTRCGGIAATERGPGQSRHGGRRGDAPIASARRSQSDNEIAPVGARPPSGSGDKFTTGRERRRNEDVGLFDVVRRTTGAIRGWCAPRSSAAAFDLGAYVAVNVPGWRRSSPGLPRSRRRRAIAGIAGRIGLVIVLAAMDHDRGASEDPWACPCRA